MKIERINLYNISMPLRSPFETSFGRSETRDCILIEAFSDGLVGYGECVADRDPGYSSETTQTAWHILSDFIIPNILGIQISKPQDFPGLFHFIRGNQMAKAGFEMALWDLRGKMDRCSLRLLLGGERKQVSVGVSVGIQASPQVLLEVVKDYLAQGYRRVKIKI